MDRQIDGQMDRWIDGYIDIKIQGKIDRYTGWFKEKFMNLSREKVLEKFSNIF